MEVRSEEAFCFQVENNTSIFDKKTRTSGNFPADMFLLQPCYVMTDFFAVPMATRIFDLQNRTLCMV